MSGFDTFVMVDWSGVPDRGAQPKPDAIWAAVWRDGPEPPVYLRSIAAAEDWLIGTLRQERQQQRRVCVGFDFPFGYPKGAATVIAGSEDPRALWAALADGFDALDVGEGRFHLAARLNRLFPGEGPFWFNGLRSDIPGLPRKKPAARETPPDRRAAETLAKGAFTCWQMGGSGAVGSQAMTGMAMLSRLCATLGDTVSVWPFDATHRDIHVVEIWPSLFRDRVAQRLSDPAGVPCDGKGQPIKDAAQVMVTAEIMARAQSDGRLHRWLDAPTPDARQAEGWILGVEPEGGATLSPPPLSNDCFALPPGVEWTPVNAALDMLRDRLRAVTGTEDLGLDAADRRILAAPVTARRANPPAPNAAVDGYGFAHAATCDGPQILPLAQGRAAAGVPFAGTLPQGQALRILTGAILPGGVDTVVLEEDTRRDADRVAFNGPVKPGANTRRAGEDVDAGAPLFAAGHRLGPADLALLAATGTSRVSVRQRLRVGVLSTGDELAAPGSTDDPARTYDANRPMLLAMAARWGHAAVDLGHVPDDRTRLRDTLDAADVDAILTSGGASAGDEDHVSALMRDEGTLAEWRIALKPGRPLALGMRGGVPVFGLPGNPVAAFVCALIFARPALSVLAGGHWLEPLAFQVPADFAKSKKPGRREYLRARMGPEGVQIFASEGSGRISGLSWAEGLVELGDGAITVAPGDPVRFLPYAGFGL